MKQQNILLASFGFIIVILITVLIYITFPFQNYTSSKNTHMGGMMMEGENDAMKEHCKMMPEMPGCEKYTQSPSIDSGKSLNDIVLKNSDEVESEVETPIVNLKNGDIYDIFIKKIRKQIGGKDIIMLSYNGSIPGPTLRIAKGSEVTIKVHNTVEGIETTIHPHGLRLDNKYDGVPKSQNGFQDPIKNGDTYEQKLKVPDTGIFWFHPHTRDDFEQELGEYGTIVVYDPEEKQVFDSENVLVLDDILLDNGNIPNYSTQTVNHTLMGRYGNTMMINGKTNFLLNMKAGEIKRLYLLNAANARPFRISIPGVKMKLIGSDNGYYQKESFIDSLTIAPAERYIVDIYVKTAGIYNIEHTGSSNPIVLGKIQTDERATYSSRFIKDFETLNSHKILSGIANLEKFYSVTPDKSITFEMSMPGMGNMNMGGMMMGMHDEEKIEWEDTMAMMNKRSTDKTITWEIVDDVTKKKNMDIEWNFKKGTLVKIHIFNDPDSMHAMQHPFHMHGQRFLVLNTNGRKNENLVWKDTVLIPKGDSVDILVDMNNPGIWMAHCHIIEHLLSGMMFDYTVQ